MRYSGLIVLAFLALAGFIAPAAPTPAIVQGPDYWTVDVRFEHLQQIMLRAGDAAKPQRFWYVILTVTNDTGREVEFYPKCELMTDTFEIIPAGIDTPVQVFEHIKKRHQRKYPFLEPLKSSGQRILQGADNTKDIAIIWPDFDSQAKEVKLFISGLSNETTTIDNPIAKDDSGRPLKIFLRKTLELDYSIAGDPAFRAEPKLTFLGELWVMR